MLGTPIFVVEPNLNQTFSKIYKPEHIVFYTNLKRTKTFKYFIEPKPNLNKLKSLMYWNTDQAEYSRNFTFLEGSGIEEVETWSTKLQW